MFKPAPVPMPTIEIFGTQSIEEIYALLIEALKTGNLRLLLDIDGTLSNFHDDPAQAFVDTKIVELIYQIELQWPGTVNFVTGRPRHEVLGLFKFTDKRDLFEVLQAETGRIPNMICNHGKAAFFGDEIIEYTMNPNQKSFLEAVKNDAVSQVNAFADKNKDSVGYKIITDDSGVKISFDVDGETKSGYLLEIKKDNHDELASFAFHWRILQSLPEKRQQAVIEEFRKIVADFGQAYNKHDQNPAVAIEGESDTTPCPYFNLSENSDCVAEFCPADAHLNKGSMVFRCKDNIKGDAENPVYVGMGDSIPGTDLELLKAAIALKGFAFNVRHSNSTKLEDAPKALGLTGTFRSVSVELNKDGTPKSNQINATLKFIEDSKLLEVCLEMLLSQQQSVGASGLSPSPN